VPLRSRRQRRRAWDEPKRDHAASTADAGATPYRRGPLSTTLSACHWMANRSSAPSTDGDALIGSVSSRLAADAPCPVLVIPPGLKRHVRPDAWYGRTLVSGFDGSLPSWSAARHAAALADRLNGSLSVVSVGTRVRNADVVRGLDGAVRSGDDALPALDVRYEHRAGGPVWELERVAAAITAPLIAIGSRGLGPCEDALLGSVARRLLQSARRPTLILPAAPLLDRRAS
jgi:nucleotide-binding universal stress UspA family protein